MNNKEVCDRVNAWQDSEYVHPLTCAIDSRHDVLRPQERDSKVVLVCPTCGRVQDWIPEIIMAFVVPFKPPWEKQP